MFQNDTICATATGNGVGALGIIRVSGQDSISIVESIFKGKKLTEVTSHTVHYGYIMDGEEIIDEVMVAVFRAPKTFTAEDLVEISCHGSPYIQQRIIDLLLQKNARLALPGEFTQRAFLNGRIDLAQAEAVADLIAAENKASHQIALNQMRGGISNELQDLREQLINFTALIELELDFSEEDVEFANRTELMDLVLKIKNHLQNLIQTFEYGNALKNGVPVAIIGKPNAGKSTLLNALLNEERAIVSDIAGTTRDTIEETLNIDGITYRFIDTAGIRETEDVVEQIGVQRAIEKANSAKVLLYLFNEKENSVEEIITHLKTFIREDLSIALLHNKIDLVEGESELDEALREALGLPIIRISAKHKLSLDQLKGWMSSVIQKDEIQNQVIITNVRHKEALQNAFDALSQVEWGMNNGLTGDLLAFHLRDALKHIGSITGNIDVDKDILGTIFGKFCIGK